MSEPELTPEQLIEQIKQLRVADLILSTVTTLAQIAYAKLEESSRDLDQARLAIDSIQVLLPKLEGHVPADSHATSDRCSPTSSSPTRQLRPADAPL